MRYLALDCEFASSFNNIHKICEFAYILFDENYNINEQRHYIINPKISRKSWDYRAAKKILTRSIDEYEESENFDFYFPKIKQLLESADYIIGAGISNDIKAINDECDRYGHSHFDMKGLKLENMYKEINPLEKKIGLKPMFDKYYRCNNINEHDAMSDTKMVYYVFKKLMGLYGETVDVLIEKYPSFLITEKNNYKTYILDFAKPNPLSKKILTKYLKYLDENLGYGSLDGKSVCLSIILQMKEPVIFANLITAISSIGGTINLKASQADIFIDYECIDEMTDKPFIDKRKLVAVDRKAINLKYQIITLDEFISIYKIKRNDLTDTSIYKHIQNYLNQTS